MAVVDEILAAGVSIGLVSTGQIYEKKSLDDIGIHIVLAVELHRGYSESKVKSERIAAAWKKNRKHARETGAIITRKVPCWFKRDDEGKVEGIVRVSKGEYTGRPIIDTVKQKIILKAMSRVVAGDGIATICSEFNEANIPPIGRAKRWLTSDLWELLTNRGLLGEYQPTSMGKTTAKPSSITIPLVWKKNFSTRCSVL